MAKITVDTFAEEVSKILKEYGEDVSENLEAVTKTVAQKGAQLVRNQSLSTFGASVHLKKGRYGTGWTYKVEKSRLGVEGVVYNSKYPGLPHLLEHGHARRGGGFVPGRPHIAPAEEEIIKLYEEEVSAKL